VVAKRGRAN